MILSPIRKVLSSIARHKVRVLLMGGQACILYGGAEFCRDIDFAILASKENIAQLRSCLDELEAEVIAVPPFSIDYLEPRTRDTLSLRYTRGGRLKSGYYD